MTKKLSNQNKVLFLKTGIHVAALLPLLDLYYLAFLDELGADPVQRVIHFTGIGAFNLLLITLCFSPVAKLFKVGFILQARRLVGLYAFSYAFMHVLSFLAFDLQFAWTLFLNEVIKRPYISIGMFAFALLIALAVTSHNTLRRMLGRNWQTLHNTSYLIVLLVAVHFYWSVKSSLFLPVLYFALTLVLLAFRYKKLKALFK